VPGAAEFCLLGPALVRCEGRIVPVPTGKQQAVLVTLLLNPNRVVTTAMLTDALWGLEPPPSAAPTIRNYVKRLRRTLLPIGPDRISTQPGGYAIRADPAEVDLFRFEQLVAAMHAAERASSWEQVRSHATAAIALWRGQPFAGTGSEVLELREAPRLVEMWLDAVQARVEADLRLSGPAAVIPELRRLRHDQPLREKISELLMLALYQSGRQAEALAVYTEARAVLVEETGAEPGAELRALQRRILAADPELTSQASPKVVPRELPGAVRDFTGRETELAMLTGFLADADGRAAQTVLISAISGTAGVGKTALALHWAHAVAERFPDGQFYANLRGYDPGQPVAAGDALAGFLRALGVPGQDIPAEAAERAARYRSLLAGRRVLVVLDNASSAEQARPLLPATAGSLAVVTSRDDLAGLVARDGARRLELDLLPTADAVRLLRTLIGGRVEDDPAAAEQVALQCARLPLALRVVAELAVARPWISLREMTEELADQRRRLDLLDAGLDQDTMVRAVFSWSCRRLDVATVRAFRLASLHPGPDFDSYLVAAITGSTVDQADGVLARLVRGHLIHPVAPGRYGIHGLVTQAAGARAWLDAERVNLVAVAVHAARTDWPGHATRLATTLFRDFITCGHLAEATTIFGCARDAARRSGDGAAEGEALIGLGAVAGRRGQYPQAAGYFLRALPLFRDAGDQLGEARTLCNIGLIDGIQGRYRQAVSRYRRALALGRMTEDLLSQARCLDNLGLLELRQGHLRQAAAHHRQAMLLHRGMGNSQGEANALANLGSIDLRLGYLYEAGERHRRALTIFREASDRTGEALSLAALGDIGLRQGRLDEAIGHQRQALTLFREIGDDSGEAVALNGLGEALLATGLATEASVQHEIALDLATQIGDKYVQAGARNGLGHARDASGDADQARRHWQEALALYTELGAPEAEQVRAQLLAVR
jgi:DNA-binding SARP family transcriptional activator